MGRTLPILKPEPSARPRPKCAHCGQWLRPQFKKVFPPGLAVGALLTVKPIGREFIGYGVNGNNHFCCQTHGYLWAIYLKAEESQGRVSIEDTRPFDPVAFRETAPGQLHRCWILLDACFPYLKDGETPAECIERHRKDIDALMALLAKEKETPQ